MRCLTAIVQMMILCWRSYERGWKRLWMMLVLYITYYRSTTKCSAVSDEHCLVQLVLKAVRELRGGGREPGPSSYVGP